MLSASQPQPCTIRRKASSGGSKSSQKCLHCRKIAYSILCPKRNCAIDFPAFSLLSGLRSLFCRRPICCADRKILDLHCITASSTRCGALGACTGTPHFAQFIGPSESHLITILIKGGWIFNDHHLRGWLGRRRSCGALSCHRSRSLTVGICGRHMIADGAFD